MNKIILNDVTLLGIDCVDVERLIFAAEVCQKNICFKHVKLLSSIAHTNKHLVRIDPITCKEEYSYFMVKKLYEYVDTKHVLVIQWDGFILNPFKWNNDFLEYDYIGAPWTHNIDAPEGHEYEYDVGNGGFSLRSRRLLEKLATDDHINVYHPEDIAICRMFGEYLRKSGFKFGTKEIARSFSIEHQKWKDQFGFHDADISAWEILKFTDKIKHQKYIRDFFEIYSKVTY
jgi:hypothetical protein